MYKNILWDFDGTLFNTYPWMIKALKETLEINGINQSYDQVLKQIKKSVSNALSYYSLNEESCLIYRDLEAKYINECEPFEGIVELVKLFSEHGINQVLYTHRNQEAIKHLEKYNLKEAFCGFVTLENGFKRKPDPEAILYILDQYGFNPKETIMIGDRDLDILAAKNANISSVMIDRDLNLKCVEASFNMEKICDLKNIIFNK